MWWLWWWCCCWCGDISVENGSINIKSPQWTVECVIQYVSCNCFGAHRCLHVVRYVHSVGTLGDNNKKSINCWTPAVFIESLHHSSHSVGKTIVLIGLCIPAHWGPVFPPHLKISLYPLKILVLYPSNSNVHSMIMHFSAIRRRQVGNTEVYPSKWNCSPLKIQSVPPQKSCVP